MFHVDDILSQNAKIKQEMEVYENHISFIDLPAKSAS